MGSQPVVINQPPGRPVINLRVHPPTHPPAHPGTEILFHGLEALEAAVHCACVCSAQRTLLTRMHEEQRLLSRSQLPAQPEERESLTVSQLLTQRDEGERATRSQLPAQPEEEEEPSTAQRRFPHALASTMEPRAMTATSQASWTARQLSWTASQASWAASQTSWAASPASRGSLADEASSRSIVAGAGGSSSTPPTVQEAPGQQPISGTPPATPAVHLAAQGYTPPGAGCVPTGAGGAGAAVRISPLSRLRKLLMSRHGRA